MATDSLIAYVALAIVVTLTPGPNMALVLRTALESNAAGAIRATLGVASGLTIWAVASAAGVAAVIQASPQAFTVLQVAGGMWLVSLGFRALASSGAPAKGQDPVTRTRSDFRAGLITNLLNPMVGAFYLAALPGFVHPGPMAPMTSLLLAAIHIAMVVLWLSSCSVLIARGADVFARPRARQFLQRASAFVLIGFGVRGVAAIAV